ncbi:MAG: hypothetical protein JOZ07_18920 [Solirubrobacterales bacterium]|nr:hypothetical protein [Solirubrobacterales bacterium]
MTTASDDRRTRGPSIGVRGGLSQDGRDADGVTALRSLYMRCKALGLAAGAGLVLGAPDPALARRAEELRVQAARAAAEHGDALRQPLDACERAASALAVLLSDHGSAARLAEARVSQRALRLSVWEVLDCEYRPCGAAPAHAKGGQR